MGSRNVKRKTALESASSISARAKADHREEMEARYLTMSLSERLERQLALMELARRGSRRE